MKHAPYSYRDDPNVPDFPDDKPVIVFDGYCVLCSAWANFVITRDRRQTFRLLAAQSPLGEALYAHYGYKLDDYQTNLLIQNGTARVKSDGSLAMFGLLGFPYNLMQVFRIIPRPIRDWTYRLIARNRLKWFGARQACYSPPNDAAERFL